MTVVTDGVRYAVLKALDGAGRLTAAEIVPESKVPRSTVYTVLAECEASGLVVYDTYQRPRKKKTGKRTGNITTKRYALTPRGRKMILEAEAE